LEDEQIQPITLEKMRVITEQLGRLSDKIGARMAAIEIELAHHKELDGEKMDNLKASLADMRKVVDDHESRLRTVQDQTTRNQVILGLTSGGSLMASLAALIKAFMGTP